VGSLEKGKWADFILIDKDYFKVPVEEIYKTNVLQTWVAGIKRYEKTKTENTTEK
jgi:predicted amidohydrolase YtcJ